MFPQNIYFNERDTTVSFAGMLPVDEAYNALRKAENIVTNPNSQENPFVYLKKMCPECSLNFEKEIKGKMYKINTYFNGESDQTILNQIYTIIENKNNFD